VDAPLEDFRTTFEFACVVWNTATASGTRTVDIVAEIFSGLGDRGVGLPDDFRDSVETLVESRRRDHGADPRIVLRVEVLDVGDHRRILVASGLK